MDFCYLLCIRSHCFSCKWIILITDLQLLKFLKFEACSMHYSRILRVF